MEPPADPFRTFLEELADGQRWKLARAEGWEDFVERLSKLIAELPIRRRQALVMLLFALAEQLLAPEAVQTWLDANEVASDAGLESMIHWLRQFRPMADG